MARKKNNKKEDSIIANDDLDSILSDDISTFSGLDDEGNEVKPKKSKRPLIIVVIILVILGILIVASQLSGEEDNAAEEPEPLSLEMVNMEQVNYASALCQRVTKWQTGMTEITDRISSDDEPVSPQTMRKSMINVLNHNAGALSYQSKKLSEMASEVFDKTQEDKDDILITDNIEMMGSQPDSKVSGSAQSLSTTLSSYSSSLEAMSSDLSGIARYNGPGIRSAISDTTETFEEMNSSLEQEISNAINDDIFDNATTMNEVASLEECNGSFIDSEALNEERGQELEEQQKISDFAVLSRCQQFTDNVASISEEDMDSVTRNNVEACNDFSSSTTIDRTDPIYSEDINFNDSEREKPTNNSGQELSGNTENSDESTNESSEQ